MSNNFNKSKQKFTCNEILLAPFENESLLLPKTHNCLYTGLTRAGLGGGWGVMSCSSGVRGQWKTGYAYIII